MRSGWIPYQGGASPGSDAARWVMSKRRVCASGGAHSKVLAPAAGRCCGSCDRGCWRGDTLCGIVESRTGAGAAAVGAS